MDMTGWVLSVAFSPDNNTLVSTSSDRTIRIWNIKRPNVSQVSKKNIGYSQLVAFNTDGQIIASFNGDHNIRIVAN